MPYTTRVLALLLIVGAATPAAAQAPAPGKPGGVLRLVLREDLPQGFAIHETTANSVTWPAMPCYSNLVIYDQTKRLGRMETIVPELAEKWSWQDNHRIDQPKRLAIVWQTQKKLEEDAARPTMGWRTDRFAHYPDVRNLIPNQVTYNCCRLQEVWLDK
jgi:ABC-type transport system substrate-binding protein